MAGKALKGIMSLAPFNFNTSQKLTQIYSSVPGRIGWIHGQQINKQMIKAIGTDGSSIIANPLTLHAEE